tara:strand:+ start:3591 stop:5588 length:1998 start_codon:yes stop_codon:yes gene_type:complete
MDLMKNINSLSIPEKISLYNCLYEDLSGKGIDGDTELAHVNKEEMEVLRSMGGSGTTNPHTNLIQFGGGSKSPPATQTVKQEASIPPELRPFVTDILEQAQALNKKRTSEGYVPFQGPRLADFTQDQQVAFQGVRDTVGASDPYFTRASQLTESSSAAPTSESVGELMNPYIQNVLDIQRREARRDADRVGQQIAARAAQQGGFGGTRDAVLAAEHERETQRNLDDIQSRGLAAAFEDAQTRFAQQRERERASGQQFAGLGTRIPEQRLRELSALENVGSVHQDRGQQALDIAQQEYEFGRTFPERTLQDYSSIIRGFSSPVPASQFTTSRTTPARATFGQKVSGAAGLIGAADRAGFFGKGTSISSTGGLIGRASGGRVARYNDGTGEYTLAGQTKQQIEDKLKMSPRERAVLHQNKEAERLAKIKQEAEAARKQKLSAGEAPKPVPPQVSEPSFPQFSLPVQTMEDYQRLLVKQGDLQKSRAAMLDAKRKLLQKQIADAEGAGKDELYAGLLRYAAADPDKGIQGLFEAFQDSPENLKKSQQRLADLRLTEAGVDLEGEEAAIEDIKGRITLSTAIQKAIESRQVGMSEAIQMKKLVELGIDPEDLQKYNIKISPEKLKVYKQLWNARNNNPIKTTGGNTRSPSAKDAAKAINDLVVTTTTKG